MDKETAEFFDKYWEREDRYDFRFQRWCVKIKTYIDSLSDIEFEKEFSKYLEWENKQQENNYAKYISKMSNVFSVVYHVGSTAGEYITDYCEDNDYGGEVLKYKGYVFVSSYGQGVCYEIFKNNVCIFQSK